MPQIGNHILVLGVSAEVYIPRPDIDHIRKPWVAFRAGSISYYPDIDPDTPQALRQLADNIEEAQAAMERMKVLLASLKAPEPSQAEVYPHHLGGGESSILDQADTATKILDSCLSTVRPPEAGQ